MKENIYYRFGKPYRKLGRDETIPKGSMHAYCNGELKPIVNQDTIGYKPSSFSPERDFYAPINEGRKIVYVVAWEYDTGGGFDWYHEEAPANGSFEKEKVNCLYLHKENWEVRQFSYTVPYGVTTSDEVTDLISANLEQLFESAEKRFKS